MQRRYHIISAIAFCVAVGAAVVFWGTTAQAQAKPGESVVTFDNDKMKEAGPATFDHLKHKEAFGEEKLNCKPCHMEPPPLFQMKKRKEGEARATMADMKAGKSCGKCHDGKTETHGKVAFDASAEANCAKCHKK